MVSTPRTTIVSALLSIGSMLIPLTLPAQQQVNQFFDSNTVDNFTVPVTDRDGVGFQYFIDTEARKKPIEEELKAEEPQQAAPAPVKDDSPTNTPNSFTSGKDVVSAFGDPGKDVPVLAQDNAPKPFKAMMAAFEVGDDQLAYGYARQWVRYMGNIQKRTSRVVEAARAAQVGESVVAGDSPESEKIKQMIVSDNSGLTDGLDPRAQQIVAQAQADEAALAGQQPKNDLEQEELKAREVIKKQILGRVPVDPKGRVDVYVFFAPSDAKGKEFAPVVNQIYKRMSSMKNANFAAFSSARLTRDALARERTWLDLKPGLMAGDSFAKQLSLTKFPAIVLVSPTTGKIIRESSDKPFVFYDELIAAVQGRK